MVKAKRKKKKKKNKTLFIIMGVVVLIIIIFLFSKCEMISVPGENNGTNNDDSSGSDGSGTSDDSSDGEGSEETIVDCGNIQLIGLYGDFGPVCEVGVCTSNGYSCDHYWNYADGVHECGCAETYFCGQYCFEYFFDLSDAQNNCKCPPNSVKEIVTRSSYQCVPNGYFCENGIIMEDVGPFPE